MTNLDDVQHHVLQQERADTSLIWRVEMMRLEERLEEEHHRLEAPVLANGFHDKVFRSVDILHIETDVDVDRSHHESHVVHHIFHLDDGHNGRWDELGTAVCWEMTDQMLERKCLERPFGVRAFDDEIKITERRMQIQIRRCRSRHPYRANFVEYIQCELSENLNHVVLRLSDWDLEFRFLVIHP